MVTVVLESGWGLGPRSWDAVVTRLEGIPVVHGARAAPRGPLVLAGHSLGGLRARIFAAEHPSRVAGVVLIEASHEDQEERLAAVVPAELRARVEALRASASAEPVDWPSLAAAARAAGTLGDRPLVVVTGGKWEDAEVIAVDPTFTSSLMDLLMYEIAAHPVWREVQRDLLRLSTRARRLVSPRAGHGILAEDPEVVAAAIRAVVDEVGVD